MGGRGDKKFFLWPPAGLQHSRTMGGKLQSYQNFVGTNIKNGKTVSLSFSCLLPSHLLSLFLSIFLTLRIIIFLCFSLFFFYSPYSYLSLFLSLIFPLFFFPSHLLCLSVSLHLFLVLSISLSLPLLSFLLYFSASFSFHLSLHVSHWIFLSLSPPSRKKIEKCPVGFFHFNCSSLVLNKHKTNFLRFFKKGLFVAVSLSFLFSIHKLLQSRCRQ